MYLAQPMENGQPSGEVLWCTGQPAPLTASQWLGAEAESEDFWCLDDQLPADLEAREDAERDFDVYNAATLRCSPSRASAALESVNMRVAAFSRRARLAERLRRQ